MPAFFFGSNGCYQPPPPPPPPPPPDEPPPPPPEREPGVVVEAAMAPLRELPTAPAKLPTRALSKLEPDYHPGW